MKLQNTIRPVVTAVLSALLITSYAGAGQTIHDREHGFTLTLPDGFEPQPDLVAAMPDAIHGFLLGDPTDDNLDVILLIERMGGPIGRERLRPEDMPAAFEGRLLTMHWQQFEVDVFEVQEHLGEIQTLTYNAQIPLKREAIQVKLFGPADRKSRMKSLLAETLAGLDGESNWIPSAVPSASVTSSQNYGLLLIAVAIVIILGCVIGLWRVARRSPKGTVLAVAAVLYGVSWKLELESVRVREIVLLAGVLRMVGFLGCIVGIVDLVRKRQPEFDNAG